MLRDHRSAGRAPVVLVTEDDDVLRAQVARAIREMGWDAVELRNGRELLSLLRESPALASFGLLVTDLRMPEVDGIDLMVELACAYQRLPTIVISAFVDDETARQTRALGARLVFSKPFDLDDLCTALQFLRSAPA